MLQPQTYTITDEHTQKDDASTSVNIPESGYIPHMSCLLTATIVGGTTAEKAEDGLIRLIKSCRITAAGGKNYFDISDGRQWLYREHFRYQGQILKDALPDLGVTSTVYMNLPIHFGVSPYDKFDKSVVLPAVEETNLQHTIEWGAISDLYTSGGEISSATMRITVSELNLLGGETRADVWPKGINLPLMEARQIDIKSEKSNLGQTDDLPVGAILNATTILILDSDDKKSDEGVSEVGVLYPREVRKTPFRSDWIPLKAITRTEFSVPADIKGATHFLWEKVSRRAIGIDMRPMRVGDVQLAFTTEEAGVDGQIHLVYYSIKHQD